MKIEFLNTYTTDNLNGRVRNDAENFFADASSSVFGDISLEWGERSLYLINFRIVSFSELLMFSAFGMNFRNSNRNEINILTADSYEMILRLEKDNNKVRAIFRLGSDAKIKYNDISYTGGDKLTIHFELAEFNALVGALYSHTIDLVEELLDHIDGVYEYFNAIPFDIVPFYEGFAISKLKEKYPD